MGAITNFNEKARVVKLEMPIPGHPDVVKTIYKVDYIYEGVVGSKQFWKTFAIYTDPVLAHFVKTQIDSGEINP